MRKAVSINWVCLLLLSFGLAAQERDKASGSPQEAVIDIGPGVAPPQAVFTPNPDYPLALRKYKIQGICVLAVIVDERGFVHDVHVTHSLDKRLDQNAVDAVKQWKFKPAVKDGKPVAVRTSVKLGFHVY